MTEGAVPGLSPGRVSRSLADDESPRRCDEAAIAASGARGASAVYVNDVFVPFEFAMETAALLPGVRPWITGEHEHNGLRAGDVMSPLVELAQGRRVR